MEGPMKDSDPKMDSTDWLIWYFVWLIVPLLVARWLGY
jgi:hypothetical protein